MAPGAEERLLLARLTLTRGGPARALEMANVLDAEAAADLFFIRASLELRLQAATSLGDRCAESELRRRIVGLQRL